MALSARQTLSASLLSVMLTTMPVVMPAFVFAADAPSAPAAKTHDEAVKQPAGKFVQDLGDSAIHAIADKTLTVEQRNDKFRNILRNSFDLQTIGRYVIGRSWNSATPEQQKEYMSLFQELVIKSYGDKLSLYTGEGFTVIAVRPEDERDTIVNSQITHPDGSEPTAIDWRIRTRDGKMGVIDVVVEGVSLSVTQRQEYTAVIQRNGGQLDGLLEQMRQQLNGAQKG
ncbi:MAG: ABC transporter substrate-binding protein [Alphaproteobacteria bacterium]|nr:ABC transporter substrate-binding protein [Alphaproteobacteria bacterium]MBV8548235.1 ABC transporter substrate-binding protein [Alphaproteobacteria bacterium]